MEFIDIATEQTTAATDALLAAVSVAAMIYLLRFVKQDRWKSVLWMFMFGFLSLAAILGTIAHGFKMSAGLNAALWHPLNFSLGLMISLFFVAVSYDIWGRRAASRFLPAMVVVGSFFFGITVIWPDSFLVFIVYEVLSTVFALLGYLWLSVKRKKRGGWLMVAGVFLTIIAASVQAGGTVRISCIWDFDHNGAFHLIQTIALLMLLLGVRSDLLSRRQA